MRQNAALCGNGLNTTTTKTVITVPKFLSNTVNPLPDGKHFGLVQFETNCRRHSKVHLK